MNLDKLTKKLGDDTVKEMDGLSDNELQRLIVDSEHSLKQAKEELDANEAYQQARADASLLSQGFREVKARQNAKIQYALHRLCEMGRVV